MLRALIISLSGILYFLISLPMMIPMRIKPVTNYNLFYMPFLAIVLLFLFYRACTVAKEHKAYVYAFFAAIFSWQLLGEIASMPVPKGVITQFSNLNIKVLGGYFYVITGWVLLKILWRTQAIKNPIAVYLMTFLSIWTFELYMDNYSSNVPLEMMPAIAKCVGAVFLILSIALLYIARKAATLEKKTVMGCLLYITLSLVIMGFGQWGKPQSFYIKYEAGQIEKEIKELQEEREYIQNLKQYMIEKGMYKEEQQHTTQEEKQAEPQP